MNDADPALMHRMTARCLGALGPSALLAPVDFVLREEQTGATEAAVALGNISGRQRVLLHETALLPELPAMNCVPEQRPGRGLTPLPPRGGGQGGLIERAPSECVPIDPPAIRPIQFGRHEPVDKQLKHHLASAGALQTVPDPGLSPNHRWLKEVFSRGTSHQVTRELEPEVGLGGRAAW